MSSYEVESVIAKDWSSKLEGHPESKQPSAKLPIENVRVN